MKIKNLKYYNILAITILIWSCQDDDLPKANFDLDAVTVFTGTAGHEKVDLIWEAPANKIPQKYLLKITPGDLEVTLDNSVTKYEIKGLNNGTNYSFDIQAVYGPKEISAATQVKLATVDELNFIALAGNEMIIASWDTPLRNDIAGYKLIWSDQEVSLPNDATVYQILNLTNDKEYAVKLIINYDSGKISKPVESSTTPGEISPFLLDIVSPMSTREVNFTFNPAFLPQSTAESFSWNFGDGGTSSQKNPSYTDGGTSSQKNPSYTFNIPGF